MKSNRVKSVMHGALILSLAALIAKLLSACYRIPFENLVGNTGFYVYQQIYPIYGIGMTFALTGFPVFISKLIAEQADEDEKFAVARQIFIILLCFGAICFSFLQFFRLQIATLMGDPRLAPLLGSVSWMFLFMPVLAVGRGYYQGVFNMTPTAISQVTEQFIRVTFIILIALIAAHHHWSVYRMGAWAMFASTFGALGASFSFIKLYSKKMCFFNHSLTSQNYFNLVKRLFSDGLIICLFAAMMVLLQLVDSFTVKNSLVASGVAPSAAENVKGIYDRAQPLVQLGMAVAVSFSSTLLPALTDALQNNQLARFRRTAKLLVRISAVISLAATVGMMVLMPEINTLLFSTPAQSLTIAIYVISVFIITLISTYNSILQSLDQFRITAVGLLLAVVVKIIINYSMIQHFGIIGASWATVVSLMVALGVILEALPFGVKNLFFDGQGFVHKLVAAIAVMGLCVEVVKMGLRMIIPLTRIGSILITACGIFVGVLVLFLMIGLQHMFTAREWLMIPGGKELLIVSAKVLKRRNE